MGANVSLVVDGDISTVSRVMKVDEIGRISAFPEYRQPYNEMVMKEIPAMQGQYDISYTAPNIPLEVLCVTVSCSGYGEGDYFNLFCNKDQWFKTWYLSEVKEGLFLGTSTFACKIPPGTKFNIEFMNVSGTRKTVWIGFRMLTDENNK